MRSAARARRYDKSRQLRHSRIHTRRCGTERCFARRIARFAREEAEEGSGIGVEAEGEEEKRKGEKDRPTQRAFERYQHVAR